MGRRKAGNGYDDLIGLMVADYRAGMSRAALSRKYGVCKPTVKEWLEKAGEHIRSDKEQARPLKHEIDEEELRKLYLDELWAIGRIAKHYGVDRSTIDNRINLFGIVRTPEQEEEAHKETGRQKSLGSRAAEPEVRQKYADTCTTKYGVGNTFQLIPSSVPEWARAVLSTPESLLSFIESIPDDQRTIRQVSDILGCSYDWVARRTRDERFHRVIRREVSSDERLLAEWIESLGVDVVRRDRSVLRTTRKELDIYCPAQKVAIEYNGTYWHSAQFKDRNYHLDKTLGCEEESVRLIHVWEHMWTDPLKRPIYENMIRHALGLTEHRVGARQTRVEKRSANAMRSFFEENNIQGYRTATSAYVLVDKKTGLDLMCYTTGHAYFGKGIYDLEIARGACRLGYSVSGGATKLWKAIIEDNPDVNSIVYYVDLNHYSGSSVSGLPGAQFIKNQPSFWNWHVDEGRMRNRDPQRHKEIVAGYKDGSILQVHNSGTAVYVWKRHQGDVPVLQSNP
jgi:hypothetical protein